jgi:hypothetical protein
LLYGWLTAVTKLKLFLLRVNFLIYLVVFITWYTEFHLFEISVYHAAFEIGFSFC